MHRLPTYNEASSELSPDEKLAQSFMPAAFINDTEAEIQALERLIREPGVGGLCFFHSRASVATNFEGRREIPKNIKSYDRLRELIRRYQDASKIPLLIAIDAEWGLGMRIENTPVYPFALTLGALPEDCMELVYQLGLRMADDCREAGIHWNLAPVVDININPDNPVIGYRSFGSNADAVSRRARALLRGFNQGGVLSCLKHYPGHGDTAVDSHLELPVLDKDLPALQREELLPFRELISTGVPAVMTGHLCVPALDSSGLPATLSKPIIEMLRQDLGFEGVVITDALNMKALNGIESSKEKLNLRAYEAGNDLLCFAEKIPESVNLIQKRVGMSRIEASFGRIWNLKSMVFTNNNPRVKPAFSPKALNRELAPNCICEYIPDKGIAGQFAKEGFSMVYCGKRPDVFIDMLRTSLSFEEQACGIELEPLLEKQPDRKSNLLLVINPPNTKPVGNFGLPQTIKSTISALTRRRNVLLYLFGSPYLMQKLPLDQFRGVLCGFQPLEEIQEAAAGFFLGEIPARGKLPVDIKNE